MNSPFHTEAPEKVREVPAVAPAKAHKGEGLRGFLFMVLYVALLALLVLGCYSIFSSPFSHYPYHKVNQEQVQQPAGCVLALMTMLEVKGFAKTLPGRRIAKK